MSAPQDTLSTPADKPTVYRAPGSVIGGGIIIVLAGAAIVDLLITSPRHWLGIAVLLAAAVVAYFLGVYPAAFSDRHRLVVRNPFRKVVLPWPRVDRIAVRLSFDVFAAETSAKYTVWAIPVSLRDRRKADRARWREAADREREARRGRPSPGGSGVFGTPSTRHTTQPLADQAYQEIEERRAACQDHVDDVPPVTATWTWQAFAALATAVLLIALAAALG
jgi:hypothetical protein